MAQKKMVIKIPAMVDAHMKQKAMKVAADTPDAGIDSIAADLKEQIMIIIGHNHMDCLAIANKLKDNIGKGVEIETVVPVTEEKKEERKDGKQEEKKEIYLRDLLYLLGIESIAADAIVKWFKKIGKVEKVAVGRAKEEKKKEKKENKGKALKEKPKKEEKK